MSSNASLKFTDVITEQHLTKIAWVAVGLFPSTLELFYFLWRHLTILLKSRHGDVHGGEYSE